MGDEEKNGKFGQLCKKVERLRMEKSDRKQEVMVQSGLFQALLQSATVRSKSKHEFSV